MKVLIIPFALIFHCILFCTGVNAQYGPPWVKTNVGFNYILRGIDFPNNQDLIGYISGESLTYNGNGIVLKTTDGGNSWISIWTGANMGLEGSCFVDENTGFVAGWPKLSSGWSGFGKTTDGGNTWTSLAVTPDVYYFTDVVFKDASNGILLGATNTIPVVYVTSNGGISWTAASGASSNVPYHACYVSGNTYFLVDNAGHIRKSVDNGLTWNTVYTLPGALLTGIDFFNDNVGMACGDNGLILNTKDGGATWQYQLIGTDIWHDFGWQSQDHVFACGTPELVAESTNGGTTWGNGFPGSAYQAALYECIFTDNGTGFICGSQGTLLKRQPSCTAAFSANQTGICKGQQVSFTSQSIGNISTYDWYFEGGTPSTSSNPAPVVTYDSAGVFDVNLIVNNGYWSDTLLQANYITVTHPAAPVISANGYTLSSNILNGNQWYLNGAAIPGATLQTIIAFWTGYYSDVVTQNGCSSDTSNILYVITGINENDPGNVKVYQLTGNDQVRLMIENAPGDSFEVFVFNVMGTKILKRTMAADNSNQQQIGLGSVPAGFYFILFKTGHTQFVRKIMIMK